MMLPILFLLIGLAFGRLILPGAWTGNMSMAITVLLGIVVFCAGVDVGCKKTVLQKLKEFRFRVILVPFGTVIGSVLGGIAAGLFLRMPLNESAAVSAGLGYYSLAVGLFTEMGAPHLAALSFLSNNLREILSLVIIPVVAKHVGKLPSIAPGGATTMDVTLPVISRYTDEETTIIAMINGVILTIVVPLLVPLLYTLGIN